MFTSATAHKHDWSASERRSCHRKPLQWAVLVFFGNNWGKLIDLSERGMSFQFARAPSLEEPIHFTFEAMGCMPLPQDAKIFGESIQATGQVVWALDFERTAGVKFLELSARSRDQIRYWISSAPSQEAVPASGGAHKDPKQELSSTWATEWKKEVGQNAPAPAPAPAQASPASFAKMPFESSAELSESDLENLNSESEVVWEREVAFPRGGDTTAPNLEVPQKPKSAFPSLGHEAATSVPQSHIEPETEPVFEPSGGSHDSEMEDEWQPKSDPAAQELESLDFDSPGFLRHEERQRRGQTLELKQRRTRLGLTAVLVGLATVGGVAGIIGFVSKFIGGAEGAGSASPTSSSGADSHRADDRITAGSASPFLVEVLDANNRRSVIWFTDGDRESVSGRVAQESALPPVSTSSSKTTGEEKPPAEAKREPSHDFSLVSPHVSSPGTNASATNSTALVEPALGQMSPSPDAPLPGTLLSPAIPAPVEQPLRQGGDVQPARLIRAKLPDYPQLARTNHAAGDVTLDALVDESGNVRDVKVISGPVLLRAAATAALLQWKYEPARLDGQPTKMHLTVTMKFKDSQGR